MQDITKCEGLECPQKNTCYRYYCLASDYQSYFMKPPFEIIKNNFKCDYYFGSL